jgi:O-antigen/teichoic acid export membrane protein
MSYSKLAIRGAFWSLLQMFAEKSTQTVVMLVAALFLGPHDFGLAAMATAPAIIIASTLQSGSQLVVQRGEVDQPFLNTTFGLFVLIGLAGALLIAVIAAGFYYLPGYDGIWRMVLPTMIAPLCAAVGVVPEGMLTRNFAYRVLTIRKTIGQALAGMLCCGMAAYGLGAWSIVVQVTLAPLISTAISIVAVRWRPTAIASVAQIRDVSRFSGAVLGISALNQINIRSVDVIVGMIAGPSAAGVFRLARTVLDLATSLFLNPVNSTLLPIFSRMSGERERIVEAMWQACGIASLVASVPFVASSFSGSYVADLIFSNKWPHLAETITVLLVSLPFVALIVPLQTYLVATAQARLALYNNLYQTIANLIMISVGAYFGIIWAAFAFSLRCFVGGIALVFVMRRMSPGMKIAKEVVTSMPAMIGLAVVFIVGAITWISALDLTRLLPAVAMTTLALSLYAGIGFLLFRARIEKIFTMVRSKA